MENKNLLKIKILHQFAFDVVPAYESDQASGMDLKAAIEKSLVINQGERSLIPTGIACQIEPGFELQIRPRSGLAFKKGLTMLNSPGTIDADYRGEIKVLAINHGDQPILIKPGERIAQMVLAPVVQAKIEVVDELSDTQRQAQGFGSTGN